MPEAAPNIASVPLPSPETEGAGWAISEQADMRIIYGIPGDPALLALECLEADSTLPKLQITRLSPADEGAGALLALVGNDHIGRIAIDAYDAGGGFFWRGKMDAAAVQWEALAGDGELTVTVPGAGMVVLNPNPLPGALIMACRTGEDMVLPPILETPEELETDVEVEPESEPSPVP